MSAFARLGLAGLAAVVALPLLTGAAAAQQPAPVAPKMDGTGPRHHQLTPEQQKKFEEKRAAYRAVFTAEQLQKLDQAKALHQEVMTSLTPDQQAKLRELRKDHHGRHSMMMGPGMMGPGGLGAGPAGPGAYGAGPVGSQLNSGQGAAPAK